MSNIEKGTNDRVKQMPWKHTAYHLISAGFIIEGLPPNVKQPYPDPSRWNTATINAFFNACFTNQISIKPANDIKKQMVMDDLRAQQDAGEDCMPKTGRGPLRDNSAANVAANSSLSSLSSPSPPSSAKLTTAPDVSSGSKKSITNNREGDDESYKSDDDESYESEDDDDPREI